MFEKLVAIEPVSLVAEAEKKLHEYAKEVVLYRDIPKTREVIIEIKKLGSGKILFNTSIGPSHDTEALKRWLDGGNNYFVCDTRGASGDVNGEILSHERVLSPDASAGRTRQAFGLLSEKVLDNIRLFLKSDTPLQA